MSLRRKRKTLVAVTGIVLLFLIARSNPGPDSEQLATFEVSLDVDDKFIPLGSRQSLEEVELQYRNLPLLFLFGNNNNGERDNRYEVSDTCARLPSAYDLQINNLYYQMLTTANATFYLYGAYLDRRELNPLGPTISVMGLVKWSMTPNLTTFCQIWFREQKDPEVVQVLEHKFMWVFGKNKPDILQPYLMTCKLPLSHSTRMPIAVSLVERMCDHATNALKVIYNPLEEGIDSNSRRFAVCVKGMSFPNEDLSVRLVEWIELLNLLGAEKIFFYVLDVHPNITKVLEFYGKKGLVDVTTMTLPGNLPNIKKLQHLYLYKQRHNKLTAVN